MLEVGLYVAVFIFLSGVLAMVDAGLLSVSHAEVEEMVSQGKRGAGALRAVKQRLTRAVVIVVIITNTINVLGPILVGQKATAVYGSAVIGVITAILTFGTIIFSEIIPKSLGAHYAPFVSRVSAPIILALIYVFYPIVILLDGLTKLLRRGERPIGTEGQIRSLVLIGRRGGHIEGDESSIIDRAFILNDRTAKDIMTPMDKVTAIADSASIREAAEKVFRLEFSRYPVIGPSPDQIRGMVLSRDILERMVEDREAEPVESIIREALTVSSDEPADNLLVIFRDRHIHLAVVREAEEIIGVVTLEDVLEELVGEIEDEKDMPAPSPRLSE